MKEGEQTTKEIKHQQPIYLAIDHLKSGDYRLKLTQNNHVIKTLKFKKK